jgi:hypothetical protein
MCLHKTADECTTLDELREALKSATCAASSFVTAVVDAMGVMPESAHRDLWCLLATAPESQLDKAWSGRIAELLREK